MKAMKWICLVALCALVQSKVLAQDNNISFQRGDGEIVFKLQLPDNATNVLVDFHSSRNDEISKLTDVAPNNESGVNPGMVEGKDMWFPVVDVELTDSTKVIARFENIEEGDRYCWNGNFWNDCGELQNEVALHQHIEHWENHIYVESESARLKEFFVQQTIPNPNAVNTFQFTTRLLTEDWSGKVVVKYVNQGDEILLLGSVQVDARIPQQSIQNPQTLTEKSLIYSLKQTVDYILKSQNLNPFSPVYGGLFLFYDLQANTYRRSDWIWGYGPSIKLLLEASKIPELANHFGYERLIEAAKLIGEASLKFQIKDPDHPAYGLVICRYDPKLYYERGFTGFASPADAHFLAGWGWVPLYEATGDIRFLDAAILQTEQIGRILTYDQIIEQDYILRINKWKNWTMDESGFGMEGFAEVYKHAPEPKYREIAKDYLDGLIGVLEAPNGLWYKNYHRNQPDRADDGWPAGAPLGTAVIMKEGQTARGNGWAMIGLLAAHRMMPEGDVYLKKAEILAENIVNEQLMNGSFPFKLYSKGENISISDKGTPLWSMLLYQLYRYTQDPKHLQAAQSALIWGIQNQYHSEDINAIGGIVGDTWASGIVYRNYFPLTCTYGIAWYGLSIIEQLKISEY